LAAFRAKVIAVEDASLPRGAARVQVVLADGWQAEALVTDPRGSAGQPLTDAELEAKFRDNAAIGGFDDRATAQIAAAWALEEAADVAGLMQLLA
jgi:2-methylcitrate dehydratase PrpD